MPAMTQKRSLSPLSHPSKLHRRPSYAASQHATHIRPIRLACLPLHPSEAISMRWGMNIEIDSIMEKAQKNLMNWKQAVLDIKELNLTLDENKFEREGGEITWNRWTGNDFETESKRDDDAIVHEEPPSPNMDIAALVKQGNSARAARGRIDSIQQPPKAYFQYADMGSVTNQNRSSNINIHLAKAPQGIVSNVGSQNIVSGPALSTIFEVEHGVRASQPKSLEYQQESGTESDADSEGECEDPLAKLRVRELMSKVEVADELLSIILQWPDDTIDSHIQKGVEGIRQKIDAVDKKTKIPTVNKSGVPILTQEQILLCVQEVNSRSIAELRDWLNFPNHWTDEDIKAWKSMVNAKVVQADPLILSSFLSISQAAVTVLKEISEKQPPTPQLPKAQSVGKGNAPTITRETAEGYAQAHIISLSVKEIKDMLDLHHLPDEDIKIWQRWVETLPIKPPSPSASNDNIKAALRNFQASIAMKVPQAPPLSPNPYFDNERYEAQILKRVPQAQRPAPTPNSVPTSGQAVDIESRPLNLDINEELASSEQVGEYLNERAEFAAQLRLEVNDSLGLIAGTAFAQQVDDYCEQAAAENIPFLQGSSSPGGVGAVRRSPTPISDPRQSFKSHIGGLPQGFTASQTLPASERVDDTQAAGSAQRPPTPHPRPIINLISPPVATPKVATNSQSFEIAQQVKALPRPGTPRPTRPISSRFEYKPIFVSEEELASHVISLSGSPIYQFKGSPERSQPPTRSRCRSNALNSSERPEIHVKDPFEDVHPPSSCMPDPGTDLTIKTAYQEAAELEDVEIYRSALQARKKELDVAAMAQIQGGKLGSDSKIAAVKWKQEEVKFEADIEKKVLQYKEVCIATRKFEKGHKAPPGLGEEAQQNLKFMECDEMEKIRRMGATKTMREQYYAEVRDRIADGKGGKKPPTEEELARFEEYERDMTEDYNALLGEGLEPSVAAKKAAKKQVDRHAAVHDGVEDQIRKVQEVRERVAELAKIKELRVLEKEIAEAAGGKKANKPQKKGKGGGRRRRK